MVYTLTCTFCTNNKNKFAANSDIHSINIRNKFKFYQPPSILTSYKKGPYYFGIKVFICLSEHTENLTQTMKQFESDL
jgi:hypothetical protein